MVDTPCSPWQETHAGGCGLAAQRGVAMGNRTFVGRDHVQPPRESRADIADGRLAAQRVQSSQLDCGIRACRLEECLDVRSRRTEFWLYRKAPGIGGCAVAQRVYSSDPKWIVVALLTNQPRQRAAHVAIADDRQFQTV